MDDRSPTQSFPNLHHHRHRPSFHLTLPSLQSPEVGYPSAQPSLEPLEEYGSRGEESTTSFPTSDACSGGRSGISGGDRGLLNTSGSGLDGDANLGCHLDRESGLGSHLADTWCGSTKKEEVWEDGESCESAADNFYSKGDCYSNANDVFYTMNCGSVQGIRCKLRRANYSSYTHGNYDAKSETVYNSEANISHFTKQTTSYARSAPGSFSDSGVDYCGTDSRAGDNCLGREEDYGCGCGSGEGQLQPAEVEGPWLSVSPLSQSGEDRWREAADTHTLAPGCLPQRSAIGISSGPYTQKLDSFSEAFLSQRKRRFSVFPSGDSPGQMWEVGGGRGESPALVESRLSCAFDSDPYLPPSSSPSTAHPSLPSFPSPPTSSHLMSSVLSPPPTPLPPPSHSPSKVHSPIACGGAGHSVSQGGESLGALQFLSSHLQSLPSVHSSGMLWKFPLLPHSFPPLQPSGDPCHTEGTLRSSHGGDYNNITASHIAQSPETFLTSSSDWSSLHPPRAHCQSNTQSLRSSLHFPSHPSHMSGQHYEAAGKITLYAMTQKVKNGPADRSQSQQQQQGSSIYTGTPFPSILHSGQRRGHYTPRPLLNPVRRAKGLYACLSSAHHRGEEDECGVSPYVNVGRDFQAELPPCCVGGAGSGVRSPEEESPTGEQLLWKPWDQMEEQANLQDQVEKLLSMCSSSCVPGGGSNTELALHCLHYCQGNTMATLEMLLFSQPSPTGDYRYSGCDIWTDREKSLFSEALGTYGKDFPLIQKLVRAKTVCQCVEFYYLSKKLQDKRKKLKEEENGDGEMEEQKSITPIGRPVDRQFGLEEAVPVPSLASFFPCKLCGKMFYKIKSRNAHMKIHRQPQEDWTDRRLQHQLLTQRLALSCPTNLMPTQRSNLLQPQAPARTFSSSGIPGMSGAYSNADSVLNSLTNSNVISPSNARVLGPSTVVAYSNTPASNSHAITNTDGGDSDQREPTLVLPFHQSWGSFGPGADPATFYCNTGGKDDAESGTVGGKEPINWQ